jgi:hypothetical protein
MALTSPQNRDAAAQIASKIFNGAVANFNLADLQSAVTAVDNALDSTLNQAVAVVGGATTVASAMAQIIPAPFSSATAQQKSLLVCYVIMKRAGII